MWLKEKFTKIIFEVSETQIETVNICNSAHLDLIQYAKVKKQKAGFI